MSRIIIKNYGKSVSIFKNIIGIEILALHCVSIYGTYFCLQVNIIKFKIIYNGCIYMRRINAH